MSLKRITGLCFIVILMLLFSLVSIAAPLLPATATEPVAIFDLLAALVGSERAAQWLSMIGLVCYLLTHASALLPEKWITKLPRWVLRFIEYLAGNYKGAKNETNRTNHNAL